MITFYPTVSCGELSKYSTTLSTALLPASSWANYELREHGTDAQGMLRRIPVPHLRYLAGIGKKAADCGGFVATRKWGGIYKYTPDQYVEWLAAWRPDWAATMDYCCENEITSGRPGIVLERQEQTTQMAHLFWKNYQDVPWTWVPTIQGWHVQDYQRHVRIMKPLIDEMLTLYRARDGARHAFRVGIGTLCARASADMIRQVTMLVAHEIGDVPLHLWGIKLSTLQSPISLPQQVRSTDSAAWNGLFHTGRTRWKQSGLPQRQYCFEVALPAYEAKIQAALSQPKQLSWLGASPHQEEIA